ncbi:MAG TPA: ATP-binding protein [Phenylobacterium sp.]|uniref:GAF domain-containing hybrid sensor histidine kinase/response regulator n=1 Tax=Phenylobacterium sp. TaxID=1871053 RepID=UPI002B494AD1|nr:ATP-binding protein [Phenylobacterium sp.]HKR89097.1 ATP-binding protein [Phenylobacterium sp.]
MHTKPEDTDAAPTKAFAELERSGPVFDRVRRLAGALFGGDQRNSVIVIVAGGDRRRRDLAASPRITPGARWVVEHGEALWVEDVRAEPLFAGCAAPDGRRPTRCYVAAPIRLDDGSVPGVLAVGGSEPRPYDPSLADRLQDLADFVADEWKRRSAARPGAVQDVAKRKAQEQALIQARDEAEAANRAKSAFLATVSHEIRTPLNGLLGMAQAMARGPLEPVQRERLDIIRQSGEGLLAILNEVLDLSKIEAGKLTLEDGEFDVVELAEAACATFRAVAEGKDLSLALKVSPSARSVYRGDPMRVRQIVYNLVGNALKFTDRGGVTIAVARRGAALLLQVRDTGIGMTAEQQANLFRAFEQAETSTTRRYGGTGLGLAICRDLVELMGGRIRARSAPGRGSRFLVSLPLPKLEPEQRAAPAPAPIEEPAELDRPIRVLAAEDNKVNQLVLKTLLNQVSVDPVIVGDGRAAVEAWAREPWDLILMDVQMPVMDGPAATQEIRAREQAEGRARTPIVALTANAMEDQVARYRAAGMDDFVAKPIAASRLFAALQAALDAAAEAGAAEAA